MERCGFRRLKRFSCVSDIFAFERCFFSFWRFYPLISFFTGQKPVAFRVFQSRISFSIFRCHSILTENLSILLFYFSFIFSKKKWRTHRNRLIRFTFYFFSWGNFMLRFTNLCVSIWKEKWNFGDGNAPGCCCWWHMDWHEVSSNERGKIVCVAFCSHFLTCYFIVDWRKHPSLFLIRSQITFLLWLKKREMQNL